MKTATEAFYLKVYRPPQSLEQTEAEALFVSALAASGVPVVKPILRTDGHYAYQVSAPEGTRPMLLFEEAPPPLPSQLDGALLAQIGEKAAKVHVVADQFATDFGISTLESAAFLEERVYYSNVFLSERDRAYLGNVARRLALILQQLPQEKPDFGLCHADLVLSNVRLTAEGNITLFDFGNAVKTWRVYDLAVIYWSLGHRYEDGRDQLWESFLEGYAAIRSLPEALSERLAEMLLLRQIGFLGGNCATLPLRLGTAPFESDFLEKGMEQLRTFAERSAILDLR